MAAWGPEPLQALLLELPSLQVCCTFTGMWQLWFYVLCTHSLVHAAAVVGIALLVWHRRTKATRLADHSLEAAGWEKDTTHPGAVSIPFASTPGGPATVPPTLPAQPPPAPSTLTSSTHSRQMLLSRDPLLSYISSQRSRLTTSAASSVGVSDGAAPAAAGAMLWQGQGGSPDAHQRWLLSYEELEIVRPIGEGSFGKASGNSAPDSCAAVSAHAPLLLLCYQPVHLWSRCTRLCGTKLLWQLKSSWQKMKEMTTPRHSRCPGL